MTKDLKQKLLPLILTAAILLADQLIKFIIVETIPINSLGAEVLGDFFRIIHVRNTGIAFSLGNSFPDGLRRMLFAVLPLAVLGLILVMYFKTSDFTYFQRWAVAGIIGGGLGNVIDRFFRPEGVVDFLDFKFYGLFGLDRWPTFNIADMSVVICGGLLIISLLHTFKKE